MHFPDPGMEFGRLRAMKLVVFVICLLAIVSCEEKKTVITKPYDGPLTEAESVEMFYTEYGQIKLKLVAKKSMNCKIATKEFPEGIYLEFYDPTGKLTSTLVAKRSLLL